MENINTAPVNQTLSPGSSLFLDGLRGLSAQVVVFGHAISFFGVLKFLHPPRIPWMQNIAVLIFFILSGFLISYSTFYKIQNTKGYSFKQFFIDRFARIYVAFIPSIIFVLAVDLLAIKLAPSKYSHYSAFDLKAFFGNLLMLQDHPYFSYVTSFGSARPFWTLAVEWWIYMFFGYFTIELLLKKKYNFLNIISLLLLSLVPFKNLYSGRGNGLTIFWLFGALIYLAFKNNLLQKVSTSTKIFMLLISSTAAASRVLKTMSEYDAVFAFLIAVVIYILIDLFKNFNPSDCIKRIIKLNASVSYTLYLTHYSVLSFMSTVFPQRLSPYMMLLLGFLASNILSFIVGYCFEEVATKRVKNKLYSYFKIGRTA